MRPEKKYLLCVPPGRRSKACDPRRVDNTPEGGVGVRGLGASARAPASTLSVGPTRCAGAECACASVRPGGRVVIAHAQGAAFVRTEYEGNRDTVRHLEELWNELLDGEEHRIPASESIGRALVSEAAKAC